MKNDINIDNSRNLRLKFKRVVCFGLGLGLMFASDAFANGNVSADEKPAAVLAAPAKPGGGVKKSVRKAPVRRPSAKKPAKKAPAKPAAKKPAAPKITSLQRGIALMEEGRYNQAGAWLQKAVQEERRNPNAWYWYGMYHDKIGQLQQAQFFYVKALEQDPAFPPLSRVVTYPDNGDRTALWDKRRPARVYPIAAGSYGVDIVPPGSPQSTPRQYRPPVNTNIPKVPVYVPPSPLTLSSGDVSQPPVYVPPPLEQAMRERAEQVDFVFGDEVFDDKPAQSAAKRSEKPVYVPPDPDTKK
ncbi:hypothetical protein FACS1894187_15620 [Synergistales bacterium]|nr:hypothetical protein FACS1894187_15620 [Synergistales bacterium]